MSRNSRTSMLTLAAAATIAVATLASQSADARGFGGFGGGFGGGRAMMGGGFGGHAMMGVSRISLGHISTPIFRPHLPIGKIGVPVHPVGPIHPILPPVVWNHHHHHNHWIFRDGRWIVIDDVVDEVPVVSAPVVSAPVVTGPGPCTCLTKTYTPSGLVVFADVCTKESASAPIDGSADATQVPTSPVAATAVPMSVVPTAPNYAGRTYDDYLAANPQAAPPQAANPQPSAGPQKN